MSFLFDPAIQNFIDGAGASDTGSSSTDALLNGDGTDADFVGANGGPGNAYLANQTAYDQVDTGTISSQSVPGGSRTTATPPGWQSQLSGLFSGASSAFSTLAPIINGKPSQAPAEARAAAARTSSGTMMYVIIGVVVLVAGFLFLRSSRK